MIVDLLGRVLLPVVLPLGGAVTALIAASWQKHRIGWFCALVGAGAGTATIVLRSWWNGFGDGEVVYSVAGGWSSAVGIVTVFDRTSAILGPVLFSVAFLIMLYAAGRKRYGSVFAGVYAIALAGIGGVIVAGDLFNLFVFFEILSLCAVILIAYERRGAALYAALRYLLVASVSIVFYLVGLLLLYRVTGELAIERIVAVIQSGTPAWSVSRNRTATFGIGCILAAVATRVAVVPFHGWLPAAHGQAPTPVSAFLSGLMLKSGFLAMTRVAVIAYAVAPSMVDILLLLGAVSAVAGAFMAFAQSDVKRLLAFSSISQMGFVVAAFAGGAVEAALFHAVAHAVFKSLLFLVVGLMVDRYESHDLETLRARYGGAGYLPEKVVFGLAAAAVIGVPGLSGFAGKELIGAGLIQASLIEAGSVASAWGYPAYRALGIASIGTVATFLKLSSMYGGSRRCAPNTIESRSMLQTLVIVLLGIAIVAQGFLRFDLVTWRAVGSFAGTAALGAGLFTVARIRAGRRLAAGIAAVRVGIDGVLVLVFIGLLAFMFSAF